ncbi:MAG: response regulator transcription factor [Lachnospiraceae bacterium]|nr:response regulator transcription factor [Lachnospiraceae bacterium]
MDTKLKIMMIEDDAALAREISLSLEKWQYEAAVAERFDDILQEFTEKRPQLVLMDINLPCHDGFYWCSQIRQISKVPVIYISSRGDDRDKIMAIAQGGDDYVEKPLRMELLRAKIEAMLRRTYEYKVRERVFLSAGLCFDCAVQSLYDISQGIGKAGLANDRRAGEEQEIDLTKSERRLLSRLVESRPDVVTRDELMMELWNTDEYVTDAALTTIISRLRTKLKSVCGEDVIRTKKGQGYYVK